MQNAVSPVQSPAFTMTLLSLLLLSCLFPFPFLEWGNPKEGKGRQRETILPSPFLLLPIPLLPYPFLPPPPPPPPPPPFLRVTLFPFFLPSSIPLFLLCLSHLLAMVLVHFTQNLPIQSSLPDQCQYNNRSIPCCEIGLLRPHRLKVAPADH